MADPTNTAAPAAQPTAVPAVTPAPQARPAAPANPNAQSLSAQSGGAGAQDFDPGLKGPINPNPVAVGAAPTKKFPARSTLITNPEPAEAYEEPEQRVEDMELPAATIAEMEAGKAALERNKPRSMAAARAADETPRDAAGRPLSKT